MTDKSFFTWLSGLTKYSSFVKSTNLTDAQIERQRPLELVTKFFVFYRVPYRSEWDFHDYLDDQAITVGVILDDPNVFTTPLSFLGSRRVKVKSGGSWKNSNK